MAGRWRIIPHPQREWIIESGGVRCAVRPDLGRVLLPLDGQSPGGEEIHRQLVDGGWPTRGATAAAQELSGQLARILAGPGSNRGGPGSRAVWLRLPLVSARVTNQVAGRLQGLAATPVLAGLFVAGAGLSMVAVRRGSVNRPSDLGEILAGLGLFFLLGLIHEFGHAAALRREGYPPGGIGLGVLFVIPVLYADVSAVAVLSRGGKLRVDLAGVCFQLGVGGIFLAAGAMNPALPASGALRLAGLLALPAVVWSLTPFIRADGYWFLSDLLNLPNLESPAPVGRGGLLRAFLIIHRVFNAAFLALVGVVFPLRFYGYLTWGADALGMPLVVAQIVAGALALGAWWGLGHRLIMLWRACRTDLKLLFNIAKPAAW